MKQTIKLTNILESVMKEAFDSPYPTKTIKKTEHHEMQSFVTAAGITYQIQYMRYAPGSWDVIFINMDEKDNDSQVGTTGSGDQMRVFSTVMESIRNFISNEEPQELIFSADKEDGRSRSRLYTTLVNRYKPEGYDLTVDESDPDNTEFTLSRNTEVDTE